MYTRTIGHLLLENDLIANGRKKIHEIDMQWPLEMQWPPCDHHGIMIKNFLIVKKENFQW